MLAAGVVAGCSSNEGGDTGTPDEESGGETASPGEESGGDTDGTGETSPAGSCASAFGDTLQPYDTSGRGMISTFSYPMGGEVNFEQSDDVGHVTTFGYGRGEISPLHSLLVGETGPLGGPETAPEAYEYEEGTETGTVTTYGGQTVPAHIRPQPDSVTYLARVEGPDGIYELSAQVSAGEGEPCPDTYDSIARQVIESFEPVA